MTTEDHNEKHLSYWIDEADAAPEYPTLDGNARVDVAVLGGGIVGLTAAELLKRRGKSVAVVEMSRVGTGVTGHSTAKITSQHELVYDYLIKNFGEDRVRMYAEANQGALEQIASYVEEYGIKCSFERQANYVYTESEDFLRELRREAAAAQRLGLPASFVE